MYCGQCGKKVMDTMLFCPFCGSPIVIPDQDEPAAPVPVQAAEPVQEVAAPMETEAPAAMEAQRPAAEQETVPEERIGDSPVSLFDADISAPAEEPKKSEPQEEFVPLRFSFDLPEEAAPADEADKPAAEPVLDVPEETPQRPRRSGQTVRPQSSRKRPTNTYIPVKDIAPDDIFMDKADEDEYDLDGDDAYDGAYEEEEYFYEEQDEGGFFHRHIRGFVGLILFIVLLAVCAFWANMEDGQRFLAKFNIAWRAEVYADLGYEAYGAGNHLMAARYYEKAYAREESNYEYAHSAMVAYYEAEDIPASAAMLKRCIAMEPDNPEPYREMLILYPDADKRPWEIRELISDGYARTGDPALK